jgi:putative addiction module killer protein
MKTLIRHSAFLDWLSGLKDETAKGRITQRLYRLAAGNAGDVKPVGAGVSEMRIDYGPGYRVYFMQRGAVVIVLLCGGNKATQTRDIKRAKALAAEWKDEQ